MELHIEMNINGGGCTLTLRPGSGRDQIGSFTVQPARMIALGAEVDVALGDSETKPMERRVLDGIRAQREHMAQMLPEMLEESARVARLLRDLDVE